MSEIEIIELFMRLLKLSAIVGVTIGYLEAFFGHK